MGLATAMMDERKPRGEVLRARWRRRSLLVTTVAAAVMLTVSIVVKQSVASIPFDEAEWSRVEERKGARVTSMLGHVEAVQDVALGSDIGGRVEGLLVEEGDRVREGDVLVKLSNLDAELEILQREAEVNQQLTNLYAARQTFEEREYQIRDRIVETEKNLADATDLLRRYERLREKDAVSDVEYGKVVRQAAVLRTRLSSMEEEARAFARTRQQQATEIDLAIDRMTESLAMARSARDRLAIRSPIDGIVYAFDLSDGDFVQPNTVFGLIVNTDDLYVAAQADQYFLNAVEPGQKAVAKGGSGQVDLRVVKVNRNVKDGEFRVEFVSDDDAGFRIGEQLTITLSLASGQGRELVIPNGSYLDQTGGQWVFVKAGDEVVRRQINLVARNDRFAVVGSGLSAGETIMVSNYANMQQYGRLRIVN